MENEILSQLVNFGGATSVIVALTFLFREIIKFSKNRNNNNIAERLTK